MTTSKIEHPRVVSRAEWLVARNELLTKEKQFTRQRDALSAERRELPWVRVEKEYVFDAPGGKETLADLFGGRSQLIVQHFMFGPGWEEGCKSCSFRADHIDGSVVHLAHRDVTLLAISRAPLPQIEAFKMCMGWHFKWVSSYGNDFNYDYHVSFTKDEIAKSKVYYNYHMLEFSGEELPGTSVFYKDGTGDIFHTYSCYARGNDMLIGAYHYLDLVPKGRDEDALAFTMAWVRHHDRYGDDYCVDPKSSMCPLRARTPVVVRGRTTRERASFLLRPGHRQRGHSHHVRRAWRDVLAQHLPQAHLGSDGLVAHRDLHGRAPQLCGHGDRSVCLGRALRSDRDTRGRALWGSPSRRWP